MRMNILFFALMSVVLINNVVVNGNLFERPQITFGGIPIDDPESFKKVMQEFDKLGYKPRGSYNHFSEQKTTRNQNGAGNGNPFGREEITFGKIPFDDSESLEKPKQTFHQFGYNPRGSLYPFSEQTTTRNQEPVPIDDQGYYDRNRVRPTIYDYGNGRFDTRPPGPG